MEQGDERVGIGGCDRGVSVRAAWERYVAGGVRRIGWQPVAFAVGLAALGFAAGPLLRLMHLRRRGERVRAGQASLADAPLLHQRMLPILRRPGVPQPPGVPPAEIPAFPPRPRL